MIPPDEDAAFVAQMEDVLAVYHRELPEGTALVCLDETSKQLLAETRTPVPCAPGQPARIDYEYERLGVVSLFMVFDPVRAWREVTVREQRTAVDFAHVVRDLLTGPYAAFERVVLVMDNRAGVRPPNTHTAASLYKAFPAAEARGLAERLEIHYTPKHGSWLGGHPPCPHGRDRVVGARSSVPESANRLSGLARLRNVGVVVSSQRGGGDDFVALHGRRGADQAAAPLPVNPGVTRY